MKHLVFFIFLLSSVLSFGQATNDQGDYIVDFAPFSPPEQALMMEFIGKPAPNFMSNDLNGTNHTLSAYKGENVILAFWSVDDPTSEVMFQYLNMLNADANHKILTYCYEDKIQAQEYLNTSPIDIPVMPKGKFLGEMVYGHDLGTPRIFFINKKGEVKDILPASAFNTNPNLFPLIRDIVNKAF